MAAYRWEQTGRWGRGWRHVEGDRLVARLEPFGWGLTSARLTVGASTYTIETKGVLRWRLHLKDDAGKELAVLRLDLGGGGPIERHDDGARFDWRSEGWTWSRFRLADAEGAPLARLRADRWLRTEATVETFPRGATRDEDIVLLVALGWFATVLLTMGSFAYVPV